MSRKRRHNIPMLVAVILLILTLLSLRLTGGLFARYRAMSASSDSARVAKFEVEATVELVGSGTVSNAINSDDTDDTDGTEDTKEYAAEYVLTVINNSEVAVSYEVVVQLDKAVDPAMLDVSIEEATKKTVSDDYKTITFTSDTWTIEPNAGEAEGKEHTLKFAVIGWNFVTGSEEREKSETFELNFTVDVTATQID